MNTDTNIPYRIAVCDDEMLHIEKIRMFFEDVELDAYTVPERLREALQSGRRYDVLFLDIMMPGLDGITLSRELRETDQNAVIVFITSRIDFMQTGYEVKAFRYLLKDQLDTSLPKVWKDIEAELLTRRDEYLVFEYDRQTYRYATDEIFYMESRLRKVILRTRGDTRTFYAKLDDIEKTHSSFIRLHKSFLANRRYIRSIASDTAVMVNGDVLPVSRKYAPALEKLK